MSVKLSNGTQHTNWLKRNGKKYDDIRGEEKKTKKDRKTAEEEKTTMETIHYLLNTIVFAEFSVRMLEFRADDSNDDDFVNSPNEITVDGIHIAKC